MQFAHEVQTDHGPAPEAVVESVEFGDFEAKAAFVRIIEELKDRADEIGFDDPRLMPEAEPDSIITAIESQLFRDEEEPVTIQGKIGRAVFEAIEMAAETDELDCQPTARFMLGLKPIPQEPKPESERYKPFARQMEEVRKASEARKARDAKNQLPHLSEPQPVRFGRDGKQLPYKEHVELRTTTELIAVSRAVSALEQTAHSMELPDLQEKIEQQDGKESFDPISFNGSEARIIYGALALVAGGLVKNEKGKGLTSANDYDKANARYILKAWKGAAAQPHAIRRAETTIQQDPQTYTKLRAA